jgi:signal transduction histidine kinase
MLYFNQPHDFTDEEVQIAQTIANQIAFSIVRQKSEDDLKQANAAKSAFLATMSHELRTPLNAILGYSDLLNLGVNGGLNAAQSGHVDRIRASACHLINVIDEILTFARAEAGKEQLDISTIDLVSLIAETASMVEPIANEKALAVNVELRGSLGVIRTDVRKLRQILLNLLSNAVKFTDRGSISLEVERIGGQVRYTIVDTGPGIAPDQQTRIFEPFWQAETGSTRRAGGTGLGLTVTAQLVELLGGRISVESQLGMGARFVVELPDPLVTDKRNN